MKKTILIVLILMSLAAFIAMGIDKRRARLEKWRISEKVLFLLALLGGAVGGTAGMLILFWKTVPGELPLKSTTKPLTIRVWLPPISSMTTC